MPYAEKQMPNAETRRPSLVEMPWKGHHFVAMERNAMFAAER